MDIVSFCPIEITTIIFKYLKPADTILVCHNWYWLSKNLFNHFTVRKFMVNHFDSAKKMLIAIEKDILLTSIDNMIKDIQESINKNNIKNCEIDWSYGSESANLIIVHDGNSFGDWCDTFEFAIGKTANFIVKYGKYGVGKNTECNDCYDLKIHLYSCLSLDLRVNLFYSLNKLLKKIYKFAKLTYH